MERKVCFDKVYGCWLGKNIGGTIGGPLEGRKEFFDLPLKFSDEVLPNDDLDLQLVWLDILRKKGTKITSKEFADAWLNNITYPWDEYGVAIANLKMGLVPPVSGYYNNWFKNGMGAPIRSEIWACIFPGKPEIAGYYAYQDASVDHWDEGVYGEVFLSCFESLAFIEDDIEKLIKDSIQFIPESSKVRKVAEFSVKIFKQGKSLKEARDTIIEEFGHSNFTDCVQNIGFTVIGLLYGERDLVKTIVSAVNCGYDTDCTGATSGAIIGIILGKENILKQLNSNFDDRIIAGWGIKDIKVPRTLGELTEETVTIGEKILKENNASSISKPLILPAISQFTPPLKFPILISTAFHVNDNIEKIEKVFFKKEQYYKEIYFDNFYFDLDKYFGDNLPEVVFLSINFKVSQNRKLKFFPSSNDGIKMWIDKELVLSHHNHNDFLPAPQRPGSPLIETNIGRGCHGVVLEIIRCKKPIEFAWIVTDEKNHLITDLEYFRDVTKECSGESNTK